MAMVGMAVIGGSAGFIALAITIAFYNFGNPLAGEAIYKVWTQESFPTESRAFLQGVINGFSRLCCGLFAFVTPFWYRQTIFIFDVWLCGDCSSSSYCRSCHDEIAKRS